MRDDTKTEEYYNKVYAQESNFLNFEEYLLKKLLEETGSDFENIPSCYSGVADKYFLRFYVSYTMGMSYQKLLPDVEKYIDYVVDTLIEFKDLPHSIKSLLYGIEWLIVDKFVEDVQKRNILCDLLGDRMSLIHEYAENKERKVEERIIANLLRAGNSPHKIAKEAGVPLSRVNLIKRRFNL